MGTLIANKSLKMNSLVWEGTFGELPAATFIPTENTLFIVGVNETVDIKGRNKRYRYLLKRYKASTPAIPS